jgi:Tfp pilus assembly protein FimT
MLTQSNHRPHSGYTLIELLVAIGLGILLAAMTVGVANSNMAESYKIVGAADRVSGWLIIAKSKAQREGAPRGVRFILSGNTITEA